MQLQGSFRRRVRGGGGDVLSIFCVFLFGSCDCVFLHPGLLWRVHLDVHIYGLVYLNVLFGNNGSVAISNFPQ